jgi:hypothetical protein
MEQQHVCRAVEASTRRLVRAGGSKDDPAGPHQAGQHHKDRQRQGSVLPKILESIMMAALRFLNSSTTFCTRS